jgi:hypothetical protein
MKRSRPDYARMSDPEFNPQWRRRWSEPPLPNLPPVRNRIVSWRSDQDQSSNRKADHHAA